MKKKKREKIMTILNIFEFKMKKIANKCDEIFE